MARSHNGNQKEFALHDAATAQCSILLREHAIRTLKEWLISANLKILIARDTDRTLETSQKTVKDATKGTGDWLVTMMWFGNIDDNFGVSEDSYWDAYVEQNIAGASKHRKV